MVKERKVLSSAKKIEKNINKVKGYKMNDRLKKIIWLAENQD